MRVRYGKQLSELNALIVQMGKECTECLTLAMQSLLAAAAIADKAQSTAQAAEHSAAAVHLLCEDIIMRQQPVAEDLRTVIAAQRIAGDVSRIAGQGAGIAEMAKHSDLSGTDDCRAVAKMADAVIKMLCNSVSAFEKRDAALARAVKEADDEVDSLFRDARQELVKMMAAGGESREAAERALDYMLIAKYLERAGDHTVSIANAVAALAR